jgi:tRNA G18 (ribose-2'-O)-methylase SpoU
MRRIAVLENVTNPTNVGAIIRSAAALGMEAVLLNHACSDPFYRRAARVSMGTVFQVPWTYLENSNMPKGMHYVRMLQSLGFRTAALALRKDTVSISDPCLAREEKLAVILGAEGDGLTDETIDLSDYTIKIPMAHGVDSLNVAACSAVAFWELSIH